MWRCNQKLGLRHQGGVVEELGPTFLMKMARSEDVYGAHRLFPDCPRECTCQMDNPLYKPRCRNDEGA